MIITLASQRTRLTEQKKRDRSVAPFLVEALPRRKWLRNCKCDWAVQLAEVLENVHSQPKAWWQHPGRYGGHVNSTTVLHGALTSHPELAPRVSAAHSCSIPVSDRILLGCDCFMILWLASNCFSGSATPYMTFWLLSCLILACMFCNIPFLPPPSLSWTLLSCLSSSPNQKISEPVNVPQGMVSAAEIQFCNLYFYVSAASYSVSTQFISQCSWSTCGVSEVHLHVIVGLYFNNRSK